MWIQDMIPKNMRSSDGTNHNVKVMIGDLYGIRQKGGCRCSLNKGY